MDIFTILIIGVGLAMDAFSVSISNGIIYSGEKEKHIFASAMFGLFQGIMPAIGFLAGCLVKEYIETIDHWVALILLLTIGGKMIADSFSQEEECKVFTYKTIFIQAIATSIDALAVGISFAALDVNICYTSLIICVVTFLFCIFGSFIGKKIGEVLKNKATLFGGIILIIIGLKIFLEHLLS